ncbi:MAG: hypothetical protein M3Y80_06745 [Verrucomicrobiota bacterium]|nr:hypothetical protein [Verrucomicrobiota bacterium]
MKALLLTSLLGAAAGASSISTYHLVHELGSGGRYEMKVLAREHAVVTLDHETGIVRYIYDAGATVPSAQWAVEFKPGSPIGQVTPPEPTKGR